MKYILYSLFLFTSLNLFADELSNTFLKVPFGITFDEFNKHFENRRDILFLDEKQNIINGKMTSEIGTYDYHDSPVKKMYASTYSCIIGADTLGEIIFAFYKDALYKVTINGSGKDESMTKYFTSVLGKPKVTTKKVDEIQYRYQVKKWRKNNLGVEFTFEYPNYPTIHLTNLEVEKTIKTIEDSYRNFSIKGVIETYNYRNGSTKDSVLEWRFDDDRVSRISSECVGYNYFILKGNITDLTVTLSCLATGEVVYSEKNIDVDKKLKIMENLSSIWFDVCKDENDFAQFILEVKKEEYTLFRGEIARNPCYE
jgi:hypothetical protein